MPDADTDQSVPLATADDFSSEPVNEAWSIIKAELKSVDEDIDEQSKLEILKKVLEKADEIEQKDVGPILVLTALDEERDELWKKLKNEGFVRSDGYHHCKIFRRSDSTRPVILKSQGEPGNYEINETLRNLAGEYDPDWIFLFGIAAGINNEIDLTDVVVSDEVFDVRRAKITEDDFQITPKTRKSPESPELPLRLEDLHEKIANEYPTFDDKDIFLDYKLASANNLSQYEDYIESVKQVSRKIGAFDMESAGVAQACNEIGTKFYIIRSISDYGDADKDDSRRKSAKIFAASTVYHGFVSELALK
jgi:nucleoside phosphorylase